MIGALLLLLPAQDLIIAQGGKTDAAVVVSASAGPYEKQAAQDLAKYVGMMSGAAPPVVASASGKRGPLLWVGEAALAAEPSLRARLRSVASARPVLRADAIVVVRKDRNVYLAGTNDESHYYAVAELLRRWGCRWFLPGDIGEVVPSRPVLSVGALDHAWAPPFEVRKYWLSWLGDTTGREIFMRRNFMNELGVPSGHALGALVKELIPPGGTAFDVPIADPRTAEVVARAIEVDYAAGKSVSLGMEDGAYKGGPADAALVAGLFDKSFQAPAMADAFFTLYDRVAEILAAKHPASTARLGFLAYANMTIPPQRAVKARAPLVAYLAPIDVDPIHPMDDARFPEKRAYRSMLFRWSEVMDGRVVIYDYDQSMLVWRDLPNPSFQAFRHDVKRYRDAKVLGFDTESRGAYATTFANLYLRGQLMWNPDQDADALLDDLYRGYFGGASKEMGEYWRLIHEAWASTIVTEHEYPVVPAIYTPALVEKLRALVSAAPAAPGKEQARLALARQGFEVLDAYTAMVRAGATECAYAEAVAAGERGLAARARLTAANGTFTTYEKIGEAGPAWWPGEVQLYRDLAAIPLLARTPLEWGFRRDPHDAGLQEGWGFGSDMTRWAPVRSDLYLQAQGVLNSDNSSYTGFAWYRVQVALTPEQLKGGRVGLRFPGLFGAAWLWVNGGLVAHRPQAPLYWHNDYRFEWDTDVTPALRAGLNTFTLRVQSQHHFAGLFRRPFLYRAGGR